MCGSYVLYNMQQNLSCVLENISQSDRTWILNSLLLISITTDAYKIDHNLGTLITKTVTLVHILI